MDINIEIRWNAKSVVSMLVLAIGAIFYIAWGAFYGVWTDIGVYSLAIVMVAFGAAGLLYNWTPEQEEKRVPGKRR
jgi:hypothetical protein